MQVQLTCYLFFMRPHPSKPYILADYRFKSVKNMKAAAVFTTAAFRLKYISATRGRESASKI